jgi:hypothetical protein
MRGHVCPRSQSETHCCRCCRLWLHPRRCARFSSQGHASTPPKLPKRQRQTRGRGARSRYQARDPTNAECHKKMFLGKKYVNCNAVRTPGRRRGECPCRSSRARQAARCGWGTMTFASGSWHPIWSKPARAVRGSSFLQSGQAADCNCLLGSLMKASMAQIKTSPGFRFD